VQEEEYSYVFTFLIPAVLDESGELQTPATSDPESCLLYPLKSGPSHSDHFIEWIMYPPPDIKTKFLTLYVAVTVHREQSVKKEHQQDATI